MHLSKKYSESGVVSLMKSTNNDKGFFSKSCPLCCMDLEQPEALNTAEGVPKPLVSQPWPPWLRRHVAVGVKTVLGSGIGEFTTHFRTYLAAAQKASTKMEPW